MEDITEHIENRGITLVNPDDVPEAEEDHIMKHIVYPPRLVPALGNIEVYLTHIKDEDEIEGDLKVAAYNNGKIDIITEQEARDLDLWTLTVRTVNPHMGNIGMVFSASIKEFQMSGRMDDTGEGASGGVHKLQRLDESNEDVRNLYVPNDPKVLSQIKFNFASRGGEN